MTAEFNNRLLHRWNPACRFAGITAIIAAMSFANSFILLLACGLCALSMVILSGMPFSSIAVKLKAPLVLVLATSLVLALSANSSPTIRISFLSLSEEGLVRGAMFTGKLLCILSTGVVLFNAFSIGENLRAMRTLGFPSILVDMILLTGRFIHSFRWNMSIMRSALQLRGYSVRRARLGTMAMIAGSLLVTGYNQSEDVYRAIILRGGSSSFMRGCPAPKISDVLALVGVLVLSAMLIAGSFLPGVLA